MNHQFFEKGTRTAIPSGMAITLSRDGCNGSLSPLANSTLSEMVNQAGGVCKERKFRPDPFATLEHVTRSCEVSLKETQVAKLPTDSLSFGWRKQSLAQIESSREQTFKPVIHGLL